jgi:hypothetical protein
MKIRVDKIYHQIPRTMTSLAPSGEPVYFARNLSVNKFHTNLNGLTASYYDAAIGLAKYKGREFLVTEATTYVRDGVDYTVYLPSEAKFIRRPAMQDDTHFEEIDFASSGRFANEFAVEEVIFGVVERLSCSRDLAGNALYTRFNGEIFVKENGVFSPYYIETGSINEQFIRLDIAIEANDDGRHLVTLFFEARSTKGAELWLKHFKATEAAAKACSKHATPLIRSENVIFYAGVKDLENRVKALSKTVALINQSYVSKIDTNQNGKLTVPTMKNISSALLNQLHYEFEAFGERFKSDNLEDKNAITPVYGPFCNLNDQIHACEGALANKDRTRQDAWWAMHASFLPDSYDMLSDEVYREFSLDWVFGTLFMGYHTLGKDLIAAFWNEDMGLFERDEIRPQRISSCELFLFFGPGTHGQLNDMEQWWIANNIDKYGFKWGMAANAIGYIPVADIVRYGMTDMDIKDCLAGAVNLAAASLYQQ